MTTEIGPQAVLSTSKSATMADAVAELRKQWGNDAIKKKAHYEEKADGVKTIVRYLKIDPTNDPEGREANAILVVFMSSGGYTIRCEIDGGMTSESVCLSLSVPGGS